MQNGFINAQGLPPISNTKYGFFKFGYNGCGPISVYNFLLCLNKNIPMEKILSHMNKFLFLSFGGVLGTNALAVAYCLKKEGAKTKVTFFPNVKTSERKLKEHGCGIILYFHGKGSHYVVVQYDKYNDNKFTIYNRSNNYPFETNTDSLKFFYKRHKIFIPLIIFTPKINRKN